MEGLRDGWSVVVYMHPPTQQSIHLSTPPHKPTHQHQVGEKPHYQRTLWGILSVTALPMLVAGIVLSGFSFLAVREFPPCMHACTDNWLMLGNCCPQRLQLPCRA